MAVNFGFFNSVNGDRLYNADDISNFFFKLISDGVLQTPETNLQVSPDGGMRVKVAPGFGMIKAKYINLTAYNSITLEAADIALNRIDRVVMRLDVSGRRIDLAVKTGTPAASPSAPALTRTDAIWELSLAKVAVASGTTSISAASITDERGDSSVCGWITSGLVYMQDIFNDFMDSIRDEVARNTLVRQYKRRVLAVPPQSVFVVGIDAYNPTLDILNVYVNGFRLSGSEYTVAVDSVNGATVTLAHALDVADTPVDFQVLKSIDGSDAESIVSTVATLQQSVQNFSDQVGGLTFRVMTQAQYDAITPDENTLYIIKETSP
jgi:hypothetical protein